MDFDKLDINRLLQKNSTKHHYIPQFLLNGFHKPRWLLYIYDKEQDKILKNPRPPGSVFFEKDRNTVDLTNTQQTSIIEDLFYSFVDNKASKLINSYQNDLLIKDFITTEDTAHFLLFLIILFWRIPYTDFAVEELMDRSEIISEETDPEIRYDLTFRKLQRNILFKHTVDEIVQSGRKGMKSCKIHDAGIGINVISDNPILFRKTPSQFSEFDAGDLMIALSSRRIYSATNNDEIAISLNEHLRYNALMIHQATKYVACHDLKILQASIDFAKSLNAMEMQVMTEMVFNKKKL